MKTYLKNFRHQGYTLAESLAELVDNSIKAQAKNIKIYLYFNNDPFILTCDDGYGMDEDELINKALSIPKDNSEYVDSGPDDLGRFGLGLKQGTFSQCKTLTILSKKKNFNYKTYSLENEEITNLLPSCASNEIIKKKIYELKNTNHGTLILWSDLDILMKQRDASKGNFYDEAEFAKRHFKMIYHKRILNDSIKIFFQGDEDVNKIQPFDPFYSKNKNTIKLEDIEVLTDGGLITLRSWLIPSDIENENLNKSGNELQGIYFSRKDRIYDYGGWFRVDSESKQRFNITDRFNRLRILVELPVESKEDWIPSLKNRVNIPEFAKKKLLQGIKKIRDKYIVKINNELTEIVK